MKKRIFSIAAMIAAMMFAASCSKDDDTQNAPAPAPSTTETTGQKSEIISVPFSITVNQGNNSLTKAKLVEDGDKLVQKFVKGDELVITGKGLSEEKESVLYLDESSLDNDPTIATFSGILNFVSTGEVTPSITLTATLRNETEENANMGVKYSDPVVVPSSDEVNAQYMFTHYGYLKAEFKYIEGVRPTITLRQYTVLLEFDLDFTGAKVNVNTNTITLGKGVTYVAVPNGAKITSQMITNGEPWTIDLDGDYENNKPATVWYYIERTTPDNCIPALFSVSDKKQVFFSKGNLLYNVTDGANPKWRFADNQYDYIGGTVKGTHIGNVAGSTNTNVDGTWIDLFGWGSWLNGDGIAKPYETQKDDPTTYIWSGNSTIGENWTTLSKDEWIYLLGDYRNDGTPCRKDAKNLRATKEVNGVFGLVILPDGSTADIANDSWETLESAGAVFLPAAGTRDGTDVCDVGGRGRYWSSSAIDEYGAYDLCFYSGYVNPGNARGRELGLSVRLVRPLK